MRRLTEQERLVLTEIGPPGEDGPPHEVFDECIAQGWGYWFMKKWYVTESGHQTLELDTAARAAKTL